MHMDARNAVAESLWFGSRCAVRGLTRKDLATCACDQQSRPSFDPIRARMAILWQGGLGRTPPPVGLGHVVSPHCCEGAPPANNRRASVLTVAQAFASWNSAESRRPVIETTCILLVHAGNSHQEGPPAVAGCRLVFIAPFSAQTMPTGQWHPSRCVRFRVRPG